MRENPYVLIRYVLCHVVIFVFYGPIKRYQRFEGVVYIFRVQIKHSTQYLGAMSWRLYLASSAPRTWH